MSEHTRVPIHTEGSVERSDGIKIYPSRKDEPPHDGEPVTLFEISPHDDDDELPHYDELPHDGQPVTLFEISPNGKYVVTYSKDNKTIIVWNVEDHEGKLEPDHTVVINHREIRQICVSDEKKIVYIYYDQSYYYYHSK